MDTSDLLEITNAALRGLYDTEGVSAKVELLMQEISQNQSRDPIKICDLKPTGSLQEESQRIEYSNAKYQLGLLKCKLTNQSLEWDKIRAEILAPLKSNKRVLEGLVRLLEGRTEVTCYDGVMEKSRELRKRFVEYESRAESHFSRLIQTSFQRIIYSKPRLKKDRLNLVNWRLSEYVEHVTNPHVTRPVSKKISNKGLGLGFTIEIAINIFSHCSLETSVALRSVSRDWYFLFSTLQMEHKRKLQKRNPWLVPGDCGIKKWSDCVLIFVARKSWPIRKEISEKYVEEKREMRKVVVAMELFEEEELPEEFEFWNGETCESRVCGVSRDLNCISRDSTNACVTCKPDYISTIVSVDANETVLKQGECQYTVPTELVPPLKCHVTEKFIFVTFKTESRVLSRDKPHYKDGITVEGEVEEKGGVVFTKKLTNTGYEYRFCDWSTNTMKPYPLITNYSIAACYNGLIWWHVNDALVPSFFDLETPGVVHFDEKKSITLVSKSKWVQGDKNSHFVFSEVAGGMEMVNLSRREVTEIVPPIGWEGGMKVVPGTENGVFSPRFRRREVSHNL